ncbi:hypothetical protein [Actinokineospora inagensis]|nr:hypothetical protein [Actinokineospora inagensis]
MSTTPRPQKPQVPVFQSSAPVEQPKAVPVQRPSVENPVFSAAKR